jgi:hypothetical protein
MHKFFIYLSIYFYKSYMFRAFILAHFQRQVYNCVSGSILLDIQRPSADTVPRRHVQLPKLHTCL